MLTEFTLKTNLEIVFVAYKRIVRMYYAYETRYTTICELFPKDVIVILVTLVFFRKKDGIEVDPGPMGG